MKKVKPKNRTAQEVSSSIIRGLNQALAHSIAWESGRNIPQGPAQRMLYIMKNNPVILNELKIVF